MSTNIIEILNRKLVRNENLTEEEAERGFLAMMTDGVTPAQTAAFLTALKMKGECESEIIAAVRTMRAKSVKMNLSDKVRGAAIDTCGTGGDNSDTLNISTAVAFVVAGCGVPVAKHGNRAVSSRSGSADVLQELGVNIDAKKEKVEKSLEQAGICFMMATLFHPSMRFVAPVRREIGFRTIFNILGPLCNPAKVKRQVIGVYAKRLLLLFASVLKEFEHERVWIVHSADGLDEISIASETYVTELENGEIRNFVVTPEDVGLKRHEIKAISGGDANHNAHELRLLLSGKESAYSDMILLNAAAALVVAGKARDLKNGIEMAQESIARGKAKEALEKLVEITNEEA